MSSERSSQEIAKAASRILELARRELGQSVPALLPAFYLLKEYSWEMPLPLSTDGVHLFYSPDRLVADFRADSRAPAKQLLHLVLHCLLGHLPQRRGIRFPALYDVLSDLKVHHAAAAFTRGVPGFFPAVPAAAGVDATLPLPALYERMQTNSKSVRALRHLKIYRPDDHRLWDPQKMPALLFDQSAGQEASEHAHRLSVPVPGAASDHSARKAAQRWDAMARTVLCGPDFGTVPDCVLAELAPDEESGISYEAFLRRFVAVRERLLTDPDALDFRWYSVGLSLYGDVPLIEPPETSEPPMPDDLVIALDTSGSCSGVLCRRFLRETLGLLHSIAAQGNAFRVLLLQCDAAIQQELLVESAGELENLWENFKPKGFGGTNFCPVFTRVEQLRREGTLSRVRGLLYLSDGFGIFPQQAPDYPTAFIIPTPQVRSYRQPNIPAWVTCVWLDDNHFTIQEASI